MALSNSQFQEVMRDYQTQQLDNKREQDKRIAQVHERVPQVRVLEQEITTCLAKLARKNLEGDGHACYELKELLADLREQKLVLLKANGFSEHYMEMQYRCRHCQDTGYANGKRCHCFEEARIELLYAQSNIRDLLERENFQKFTYDYFDNKKMVPTLGMTQRAYMELVVRKCKAFIQEFPQKPGNLLFTGSTGVGKTFLTNCIAKELISQSISVIYLSAHDMFEIFSKYKFSYEVEDNIEEVYHSILECQMLIIDDIGTEMNNTFVSSQLFYCINERINRNKGTIISTNLSMDLLRDTYSDRVTSRIVSHYTTIPLYGEDIRVKKRQKARD